MNFGSTCRFFWIFLEIKWNRFWKHEFAEIDLIEIDTVQKQETLFSLTDEPDQEKIEILRDLKQEVLQKMHY